MKNNLFIFGTKNFNNTLNEIKEYLGFSLIFFEEKTFSETLIAATNSVLVDADICREKFILNLINKINNKPVLLLEKQELVHISKINYTEKIILPLTLEEITNTIRSLITSTKFNKNSSIKIKEYIINKNERKLTKENLFIAVTEREIELIELLFAEKKPLSKYTILKKVWKYSVDADTHTLETHIHRLRKKILNKFKDDKFIINSKEGYLI